MVEAADGEDVGWVVRKEWGVQERVASRAETTVAFELPVGPDIRGSKSENVCGWEKASCSSRSLLLLDLPQSRCRRAALADCGESFAGIQRRIVRSYDMLMPDERGSRFGDGTTASTSGPCERIYVDHDYKMVP